MIVRRRRLGVRQPCCRFHPGSHASGQRGNHYELVSAQRHRVLAVTMQRRGRRDNSSMLPPHRFRMHRIRVDVIVRRAWLGYGKRQQPAFRQAGCFALQSSAAPNEDVWEKSNSQGRGRMPRLRGAELSCQEHAEDGAHMTNEREVSSCFHSDFPCFPVCFEIRISGFGFEIMPSQ